MVLRHLCRPRDPCGAEIKAGAVSINDALALSIAELASSCQSRYIATKYVWAIAHSPRPREGDSIRALLSTNVRPSRRPWAVNRLPIPNMERPACGVVQDLVTGL